MNNQLKALLELQEIDSELYVMRGLREQRPLELTKEQDRLASVRSEIARIDDAIKNLRRECDHLELAIKQHEAEVEKLQVALNASRSNEEYQVFKGRIGKLGEDREALENKVLERFGSIDTFEEERNRVAARLEDVAGEVATKEAETREYVAQVDE